MSKLRINCFAMSLEGFGAGPDQSITSASLPAVSVAHAGKVHSAPQPEAGKR